MVIKCLKKFLETLEKSLTSKIVVLSEYSSESLNFKFQNPNFLHSSGHIIVLVRRTVMIFLLTSRNTLGAIFRYFEYSHKVYRKIFNGFRKKFSPQTRWFWKRKMMSRKCIVPLHREKISKHAIFATFEVNLWEKVR